MQEFIGTRTTLQIRSHAQKYFINWQKKAGAVDINEKGFTQKCVNELLKKLKNADETSVEGISAVNGTTLPQYPSKKERGIFSHQKCPKKVAVNEDFGKGQAKTIR